MEMLKNKHSLVYQLLGKYGNVEIMEKMAFQISIEKKNGNTKEQMWFS